jgi:hypothetical protein
VCGVAQVPGAKTVFVAAAIIVVIVALFIYLWR